MNTEELAQMTDKKLLKYIVTHRDKQEAVEARRVYIRRMAEKAKSKGIQFDRSISTTIIKLSDN